MQFAWKIEQLEAKPVLGNLQKVVNRIHWRLCLLDDNGQRIVDTYGSNPLPEPEGEVEGFVPFEQITEAQVLTWLESAIGDDQLRTIREVLTKQAEALAQPKVISLAPPWSEQ